MIKYIRRALAGLLLTLALVDPSPAQPNRRPWERQQNPPEPINLDIPEEEIVTPEVIQERELAVHAIRNPKVYRELLLQLLPDRGPKEETALQAILNPHAFRKARPRTPEQARAEKAAEHAILNPQVPPPFVPNQN